MGKIEAVVLVMAIVIGLLVVASRADARPYPIRWQNMSESIPASELRVCAGGTECEDYAAPCLFGSVCTTIADLPDGTHELTIHARGADTAWSGPSAAQTRIVGDPDGGSGVCASDACRTIRDFGRFLGVIGDECIE